MGSDGAVVGRAVQKRRLALLARLALAPGRTLSRDKIIALLWPDASTEQARHLLSVSLHELRRSLGEDVLQARGDDLTLNAQAISTDVEAFEAALRGNEPDQAIALYTGPFMDGFFTADAPELEQWIEGERTRLSRAFASALEQSARGGAERGELAAAAQTWRRLAALDPYNGRVARELMLGLEAAGDHAAALQHARVYAALLEQEFGTQPDAEFLALVERLRRAPAVARAAQAPAVVAAQQPKPAVVEPRATPQRLSIRAKRRAYRTRRWLSPVLATAALALLIWLATQVSDRDAVTGPEASIAVLPFRSYAASDTLQYFGDGLSEEIINSLSRLSELRVASATSSFLLRNTNVRDVGEQLGVRSVLEGTVRAGHGRLKVTARLIDARAGTAMWGDDYDYDGNWSVQGVVDVQEEIARAVVRALAVELMQDTASMQLARPTTHNMRALEYWYNGRLYFHRRTPADVHLALNYFRRAVAEDSTYARAWVGIADAYVILGAYDYGLMAPKQAFPLAKQAAQRALRLQPDLPEAHAALGTVLFNYDYDWVRAEAEFKRALELNPGDSHALHWYSLLLATQERLREAQYAATRAREVDPISPVMASSYARHLYFVRNPKGALDGFLEVLAQHPQFVTARAGSGMALVALQQHDSAIAQYQAATRTLGKNAPVFVALTAHAQGLAGRADQARAGLTELQRAARSEYVPPEYFTLVYLGLGDHERALDSLEAAHDARSGGIAYLRIEPVLDPIRAHPRFNALLEKVGLK